MKSKVLVVDQRNLVLADGMQPVGSAIIEVLRRPRFMGKPVKWLPRKLAKVILTHNLVVTVGKNKYIDEMFNASAYTAEWYVGLKDTTSPASGDTMSSKSWSEVTAYSESVRETLVMSSASSGSANNSASKAEFTISSDSTQIGGIIIVDDNTKGGTSGTLFAATDFASPETLNTDDVLRVQYTTSL